MKKYKWYNEYGREYVETVTEKLKDHHGCKCGVIITEKAIMFKSYGTIVIVAERLPNNEYAITCTGTYSQTTRRQIGYFLKEYFPGVTYYDMKAIAEQGVVYYYR